MNKAKLESDMRLDVKMRLVEAIADELHLGSTLGILLGHECRKLPRLKYSVCRRSFKFH